MKAPNFLFGQQLCYLIKFVYTDCDETVKKDGEKMRIREKLLISKEHENFLSIKGRKLWYTALNFTEVMEKQG